MIRAILMYHSIDPSGSPISIDAACFERHLEWLSSGAARVLPLAGILAAGAADGRPAVALTFDDAFASFGAVAWPRLRDRGLPATAFVVSDRVGTDNAWSGVPDRRVPRLPLLDWDALGVLSEQGCDIGAHSRTHPHLPGLAPERLRDEVEGAALEIERRLGVRPRTFAYPFGAADAAAVAAARQGYAMACTTELGWLDDAADAARLPRLDAFYLQRPGRIEDFGSAAFARFIARRAWMRRVRASLWPW